MKKHPMTEHCICQLCDEPFTCHGYLAILYAAIPNVSTCGTCLVEEKDIGYYVIKKCTCKHKFQDKRYGKGRRVHTTKDNGGYTCTVCEQVN